MEGGSHMIVPKHFSATRVQPSLPFHYDQLKCSWKAKNFFHLLCLLRLQVDKRQCKANKDTPSRQPSQV